MQIEFFKYQATGNDFILIDDRKNIFPAQNLSLISKLCNRKFGIGSDGLILIKNSDKANFEMDFYNPDGSKSFCGNGSRCAVLFAKYLNIFESECTFIAIDGLHKGLIKNDVVTIAMRDVIAINELKENEFFINTGSPHFIRYQKNINDIDINSEAYPIRHAAEYKPGGVNVNFIKENNADIEMRTFERGVEAETLSCGTGVTAAGLSFLFKHNKEGLVNVQTKGGSLSVFAIKNGSGFSDITLTGTANFVFKGLYEI